MMKLFLVNILCLVLFACGKPVEDSSDSGQYDNEDPNQQSSRLEVFKKDQKLFCEDGLDCPSYIGKIVVVGKKTIDYCTGTLIAPNKVVTSANCLPSSMRIPGIKCDSNIFTVFENQKERKSIIRDCKRILYADNNPFLGFPPLWKSDAAVIELAEDLDFAVADINSYGVDEGELTAWKVDYKTDKIGVVTKQDCRLITKNYLNPFSDHPYSSMLVATGCEFELGNIGSPLIKRDKIMGMYSKEMSNSIYSYLQSADVMKEEMGRYFHFFNTSCLAYDERGRQSRLHKECLKDNTFALLDIFRSRMLRTKEVHQDEMDQAEVQVEQRDAKYFKWDVEFKEISGGVFQSYIAKPECIFKPNDWIDEFRTRGRYIKTYAKVLLSVPKITFKTKLNANLRPVSARLDNETESSEFDVEFNPYNAYVNGITDVTLTNSQTLLSNLFQNIKKCH